MPPLGGEIAFQHQLLKLGQRPHLILGSDRIQLRDFQGELFYFFFVEILEDIRSKFGAKQHEKHGRLPASDEVATAFRQAHYLQGGRDVRWGAQGGPR